jgi:hypothetical protein
MKKIFVIASALLIVSAGVIWSCDDQDASESPVDPSMNDLSSDGGSSSHAGYPFREDVGTQIADETAKAWKANFKKKNPSGAESHFFGKHAIERLMKNENVVGISIHYAINDNGVPQLLLVGVDAQGKLLQKEAVDEGGRVSTENVGWLDMSTICPPACNE